MSLLDGLNTALSRLAAQAGALNGSDRRTALTMLVDAGLDKLPAPGHDTLARWRALSAVAACDLSLVKLFEGHTDALAILEEVDPSFEIPPRSRWGTWAAEVPGAQVVFDATPDRGRRVKLNGMKAWCSGAAAVSHGLLTAWRDDGEGPWLVAVAMDQPGVRVTSDGWAAVGMAACASVDVRFVGATATLVGGRRAYLDRAGFWQGGCGIAACWHGGSVAVGDALRRALAKTSPAKADPHKLAALGAVDVALARNAALLREAARWIDDHPAAGGSDGAMALALRVRAAAEDTVVDVLHHAGHALGAAPFCRDARFARLAADLPVFVRQSHAERDLAALGATMAVAPSQRAEDATWGL